MTRWTNLFFPTYCGTLRYLFYCIYDVEIKLHKREQQMLTACFERCTSMSAAVDVGRPVLDMLLPSR